MTTHAERTTENKNLVVANDTSQKNNANNSTFQFADNRPETITQRKLQKISNTDAQTTPIAQLKNYANNFSVKIAQKKALEEEELLQGKFNFIQKQGLEEEELLQGKFNTIQKQALEEEELLQGKFKTLQRQEIDEEELLQGKFAPIQKKENNTGLPDNLKSGIENLSGHSLDDVKVHYNSDKPAQLNAHAYAQGTDIHLGSGQEKHLPHEAWHVVQQKQGRVKPTMQMKGKVNVNDDVGLEKEADDMGAKALQMKTQLGSSGSVVQRKSNAGTIQFYDVVRGGTCLKDQFISGSGVVKADDDTLSGVSTQSKNGVDRNTLCGFFRNGQVGIADDTDITGAGGELVHDGGKNSNHATVNGLTGTELENIFTPTIANPNRRK